MGVVYKLKTEIKDFILEKKKADPNPSCRKLATLVLDKFQFEISKSSINSVIKAAGLSMPVGRRHKKRRRRPQIPTPPQEEIKLITGIIEVPVEKPVEAIEVPVEKPVEAIEVPVEKPVEALSPLEPVVEKPPLKELIVPSVEVRFEVSEEAQCTGAILLKAADYLIGGTQRIVEAIKNRLKSETVDILAKTECLIYQPLFETYENTALKPDFELWPLINQRFTPEEVFSYLNNLQEVSELSTDIFGIISSQCEEVRCLKVGLFDGSTFYLDGQLYTIWSTPAIPYDFSTSIYNIKGYINKYFQLKMPFLLFMAPGYDKPIKEFFDFMLSLDSSANIISRITLFSNKLEELEVMHLGEPKKLFFVFGLWPWQFGQFRIVKSIGDFKLFNFAPLKRDFYIADLQIELLQPDTNERVTLRGSALKTKINEKPRLLILSNLPKEKANSEELSRIYINHWPNLEETFQDFSQKIELFTYMATSQQFFSIESLNLTKEAPLNIKALFEQYLRVLDLYVRLHFLPSGYEDRDFATIKEQFYSLKTRFKKEKGYLLVTFQPPPGYSLLKDLEYACHRINEREIILPRLGRLWFTI